MNLWFAAAVLTAAYTVVPELGAQSQTDSAVTEAGPVSMGRALRAAAADTVSPPRGAGPLGPRMDALAPNFSDSAAASPDTGESRPRAIEYSDAYGTRLTIHRYAAYAELPLFAAEYALGQSLLHAQQAGEPVSSSTKSAHAAVAGALGVLFAVNTVTGVWNLVEARHDPAGRTRRTIHGLGMLLADAGFLYTASLAGDAGEHHGGAEADGGTGEEHGDATAHRNAALVSISIATASTLMMWIWKD